MAEHLTTAEDIVAHLRLEPHPEGGWYRQTFEDRATDEAGRARSTAIYYLLARGQQSARHRVDAAEVWHWYAGAPLELTIGGASNDLLVVHVLGNDFASGHVPQQVVPAGDWQSARTLGPWSLVGCTVAPGFRFEGFELA